MSTGSGGVVGCGTLSVQPACASLPAWLLPWVWRRGHTRQDLAQYQKSYNKDHFPIFHLLLLFYFVGKGSFQSFPSFLKLI
jgi:hypothetical protein